MSLDNDIRRSLERHAGDVSPQPAAFDRVEQRIRRAHAARAAVGVSVVVTLIVAASVVIPRLGTDARNDGFAGPGDPPAPTTSPSPMLGPGPAQVTFWDPAAGFAMFIPETWRATEFEGNVELLPPGQVGLTAGEDTFALEIQLRMGEHYMDLVTRPGDSFEEETEIAGRPAYKVEYDGEHRGSGRGVIFTVDWASSLCRIGGCSEDPNALLIHASASTPDRWESFGEQAVAAVESLVTTRSVSDVPLGPYVTRRGTIAGDVAVDDRLELLVRFLEARAHSGGAEEFLSQGFDRGYDLYTVDGEAILTYAIVSGAEADANSSEYMVELDGRVTETIGVGESAKGPEIRFIQPA